MQHDGVTTASLFLVERILRRKRTSGGAARKDRASALHGVRQIQRAVAGLQDDRFDRFHTDRKLRTLSVSMLAPAPLMTISPRRRTT